MKKIFMYLLMISMCILLPAYLALADNFKPPKEGSELPLVQLPTPETSEERNYLGIEEKDFFTIPKIKANLVIIYFFSFYCRFCAEQAVHVNELYRAIDNNPDLKKKIKLIGIGIGNTPTEVDAYKETHRIPFPLLPDPDFAIHKAYGEIKAPNFLVAGIKDDGRQRVVCRSFAFYDANDFLKLILKKSELTKSD
jgi:peroxiredoxin